MTAQRLVIDDVGKVYGSRGEHVVAVEGCSLTVEPGELHVIVGPSGCGKSTLLSAVAGFSPISSGAITLGGREICSAGTSPAPPSADRVVVFQDSTLFPWLTLAENVAYGPRAQGVASRSKALASARERLDRAGLSELADRYPSAVSTGVQRRVEILRALSNDPAVLLLDEPFRGMDAQSRSKMHEALLEMHERSGVTVVFITHDIEEAIFLGSHVSVMTTRPGRIKTTVEIDLPRPRTHHVVTTPRFRHLAAEVTRAVRAEALRAFEAGEREVVR